MKISNKCRFLYFDTALFDALNELISENKINVHIFNYILPQNDLIIKKFRDITYLLKYGIFQNICF